MRLACGVQRHGHERIDRGRAALEQSVREHGAEDACDRDLPAVLEAMYQFDQRKLVAVRDEGRIERGRTRARARRPHPAPAAAKRSRRRPEYCAAVLLAVAAQVERGRLSGIQAQHAGGRKEPMNQ